MRLTIYGMVVLISVLLGVSQASGVEWRDLIAQADSVSSMQNQDSALILGNQALKLARIEPSVEDTALAGIRFWLGRFHYLKGEYIAAESLWSEVLSTRENILGLNHLEVFKCAANLSAVCKVLGKFTEAEVLAKRVLVGFEEMSGPESIDVARNLNNLANLYFDIGRFADVVSLSTRALKITEKTLGPDHVETALCLNTLAGALREEGRLVEAEKIYRRTIDIFEKVLGPNHPHVALVISNLANIYKDEGRFIEADSLYARSANTLQTVLGPEHPEVLGTLLNQVTLALLTEQYEKIEQIINQVQPIIEKTLGFEHPIMATCMHNLATLRFKQEYYAEAESLFVMALSIQEKAIGANHFEVAVSCASLSDLYRSQNNLPVALEYALRSTQIRQENFLNLVAVLSETDALEFSSRLKRSINAYLQCYLDMETTDPQIIQQAANIMLLMKGQVSDAVFERQRSLFQNADSSMLILAEKYRCTKFLLSQLFVQGPGTDLLTYQMKVDSLNALTNAQESELAVGCKNFNDRLSTRFVDVDRAIDGLPNGAVLVEYLRHNYISVESDHVEPRYLALVLSHDSEPVIKDLGSAVEIDSLVNLYRQHILRVSAFGGAINESLGDEFCSIANSLYLRICLPLKEQIAKANLLLIAPDGALNMIPFATLMDQDGIYLVEKLDIHNLSCGRDLVPGINEKQSGKGLFALGDPDFESENNITESAPSKTTLRGVTPEYDRLREILLNSLPGTRREVEMVVEGWRKSSKEPVVVLFGADATENRFKNESSGKRIIYLATHGYYLGESEREKPNSIPGLSMEATNIHPLLRSGLFLAGANGNTMTNSYSGDEDAILTAYEVSAMDLSGTDLVVLSACETGLGDVHVGEGVYGLRRAFQMAGARTVVSTLWSVSDEHTADIFSHLLLERKDMLLPSRIRQIQLSRIKELRKSGKINHPFSWGAFVISGDWH